MDFSGIEMTVIRDYQDKFWEFDPKNIDTGAPLHVKLKKGDKLVAVGPIIYKNSIAGINAMTADGKFVDIKLKYLQADPAKLTQQKPNVRKIEEI